MAASPLEVSGGDVNKVRRALQGKQCTSSLLVQPARDGCTRWVAEMGRLGCLTE